MEHTVQAIFLLKNAFHLLFDDSEDECSDNNDDMDVNEGSDFQTGKSFANLHSEERASLPRITDRNFKTYFRVNADVFEFICKELYPLMHKKYGPGRSALKLDKQVMITLWYLGNLEGLRGVSKRFGVCTSTSWKVILDVCETLHKYNEQKKNIRWPTKEEAAKTVESYNSTYKINGVIGCIDSCHISIRTPSKLANSYLNKIGRHSVLLQAVSNEKMEFLFVHAGERGSLNNSTLLKKSGIEAKINAGEFQISNEQHLIGDCSYPLLPWLITPHPYSKSNSLKDKQIYFNTIQYECLDDIKRTFGLLKGRFRRLYHIDSDFPNKDVKIEIEDKEKYLHHKNHDSAMPQAVSKRNMLTDSLHNK